MHGRMLFTRDSLISSLLPGFGSGNARYSYSTPVEIFLVSIAIDGTDIMKCCASDHVVAEVAIFEVYGLD